MSREEGVNPILIIFQRMCIVKSKALTWAVIIGVIVTFVVPTTVMMCQEKEKIVRLKNAYSVFSQAYTRATIDNSTVDSWDIGSSSDEESSVKLYDYFKPYLIKTKSCGKKGDCFSDNYKALFADNFKYQPSKYSMKTKGILSNGISFLFLSSGSGCETNYTNGHFNQYCGSIFVDVNGSDKPNRAGVDLFGFGITPEGIFPFGVDNSSNYKNTCKYKDFSNTNGITCTNWAINNENMDYLKKSIY